MLLRIKPQRLDIVPRILIVKHLLPDAVRTTCNQRLEKVYGTEHSHILRVPFRTEKGILRKWISRIEVWPYLETFTECTIARALEKTKYPDSDIYWKNFEENWDSECEVVGAEGDYNVLVMDLFGPSLEDLFNFCSRKLSLKTVLMLADQMINQVEFVHTKSFLHQDIKPDNFLMDNFSSWITKLGLGRRANQIRCMEKKWMGVLVEECKLV
ncbi:hypothetical protein IFM89_007247 [Coptis chinensis]|uniref:sucrose synthase n=1 Tax=Coptis chinensis TaxID=261450 RepID=A0A835ILP6_9MAGN|nr:hypothetical protein IFM89_007247 [Coptis chinensis]